MRVVSKRTSGCSSSFKKIAITTGTMIACATEQGCEGRQDRTDCREKMVFFGSVGSGISDCPNVRLLARQERARLGVTSDGRCGAAGPTGVWRSWWGLWGDSRRCGGAGVGLSSSSTGGR